MQKRQQGIKHTLINKVIRASPELKRSDSPRLFKYIEDARNDDVAKHFRDAGHHVLDQVLPAHAAGQAKQKFNKEKDTRRIPPTGRQRLPAFDGAAGAGTVHVRAFRTEPDSPSNMSNPERTARQVRRERNRARGRMMPRTRLRRTRSTLTLAPARAQPRSASY